MWDVRQRILLPGGNLRMCISSSGGQRHVLPGLCSVIRAVMKYAVTSDVKWEEMCYRHTGETLLERSTARSFPLSERERETSEWIPGILETPNHSLWFLRLLFLSSLQLWCWFNNLTRYKFWHSHSLTTSKKSSRLQDLFFSKVPKASCTYTLHLQLCFCIHPNFMLGKLGNLGVQCCNACCESEYLCSVRISRMVLGLWTRVTWEQPVKHCPSVEMSNIIWQEAVVSLDQPFIILTRKYKAFLAIFNIHDFTRGRWFSENENW